MALGCGSYWPRPITIMHLAVVTTPRLWHSGNALYAFSWELIVTWMERETERKQLGRQVLQWHCRPPASIRRRCVRQRRIHNAQLEQRGSSRWPLPVIACQFSTHRILLCLPNSFCKHPLFPLFPLPHSNNLVLIVAQLFELSLAATIIYLPVMNHLLSTSPVDWHSWLWTLPTIVVILVLEETRKLIIRWAPRSLLGRALHA